MTAFDPKRTSADDSPPRPPSHNLFPQRLRQQYYGFTLVKKLSYGVIKKQRGKSANAMCLALPPFSENSKKFSKKRSPRKKLEGPPGKHFA
jgi:hypothetical protein